MTERPDEMPEAVGAEHYTIAASATALREAGKLPPKIYEAVTEFLHGDLARNPRRVGHELRGPYAGIYSARRGTYRIVYQIDDASQTVTVITVGARSDIYRPRG
jgi:mRNA interferase RelE/StbE